MPNDQVTHLLRLPAVSHRLGRGRNSIYEDAADGLLTKPVKIGAQSVAWPDDEIEAIARARIAGKSDDEIRQLVVRLETARTGKPATPRRKTQRAA